MCVGDAGEQISLQTAASTAVLVVMETNDFVYGARKQF